MEVNELLLRIALSFLLLFGLARIMGRKEITQMTFFNFISAIAIGSIAANLVVSQTLTLQNGIIALFGWTCFTLLMGFLDIKSKSFRRVSTGDPVILIKHGEIIEKSLQKTRLNMDVLKVMLREKDVFKIADVDYAIFETNGKLSVMKKSEQQPLTKGDMDVFIKPNPFSMATEVISDGKINTDNLSLLHLDEQWLDQQLKLTGVNTASEVFYAEVQPDGTLYVDKENTIH